MWSSQTSTRVRVIAAEGRGPLSWCRLKKTAGAVGTLSFTWDITLLRSVAPSAI